MGVVRRFSGVYCHRWRVHTRRALALLRTHTLGPAESSRRPSRKDSSRFLLEEASFGSSARRDRVTPCEIGSDATRV